MKGNLRRRGSPGNDEGTEEDNYPSWREARAELKELPLTAEVWSE
jgi:hypothetical protein